MHGHSNVTDPNEFATPESFAAARKLSRWFKVNLDIGHFTAANYDAVAYIKENPGKCLLGAIAAGYIIGRIARR